MVLAVIKRRIVALLILGAAVVLYVVLQPGWFEADQEVGSNATIEAPEVDIEALITARVDRLHVREGDGVEEGQLLVELDCDEPEATQAEAAARLGSRRVDVERAGTAVEQVDERIEAAVERVRGAQGEARVARHKLEAVRARHRGAAKTLQRVEGLARTESVAPQELDDARARAESLAAEVDAQEAAVDAALARLRALANEREATRLQRKLAEKKVELAELAVRGAKAAKRRVDQRVGECRLRAPMAGSVEARLVEPGELVRPGMTLLSVIDIDEVEATFYVANAHLDEAEPGRRVEVVADSYPGRVFEGTIRSVARQAEFTPRNVQTREDRARLVYGVDIVIPNPDGLLRPGMPVEVTIPPPAEHGS